jgi:hypothetical protein
MGPKDSFRLVTEDIAGRGVGLICAFLFLAWAVMSMFDYADMQDRKAEIEAKKAALVQAHIDALNKLSHPCGATIRDGYTSVTMNPERCVRIAEGK